MEYNFKEIGERIRGERVGLGLSQDEFIYQLNCAYYGNAKRKNNYKWERTPQTPGIIGRNTLSNIENGEVVSFDLRVLSAMAILFKCEIGYLLYEPGYENKTRAKTDISAITGLSSQSVEKLIEQKDKSYILNSLIHSPLYEKLISDIDRGLGPAYHFRGSKNELKEVLSNISAEEKQKELLKAKIYEINDRAEEMKRYYIASVYSATVTLSNAIGDFSRFDKTQKEWDSIMSECKRLLPRS